MYLSVDMEQCVYTPVGVLVWCYPSAILLICLSSKSPRIGALINSSFAKHSSEEILLFNDVDQKFPMVINPSWPVMCIVYTISDSPVEGADSVC